MTNLPRQPQPVKLTAEGDPNDIEYYLAWIKRLIETLSYANVEIRGRILIIFPGAVND